MIKLVPKLDAWMKIPIMIPTAILQNLDMQRQLSSIIAMIFFSVSSILAICGGGMSLTSLYEPEDAMGRGQFRKQDCPINI